MISINVNNTIHKVAKEATLNELLLQLKQSENGIAVAINNSVITKTDWNTTQFVANDSILIIKATQGG